ncbi:MAG: hypothetical protein ACTSWD_02440 [Candidatus Heimdallarchaeota archaeon]
MKKRIQLDAQFSDSVANDILNQVESIKSQIFTPSSSTPVVIIRQAQHFERSDDEALDSSILLASVDFDADETTHFIINTSGINVKIDISFINESDAFAFVNYIETKKSLYIGTFNNCRFFDCRHDENPLQKDGSYVYLDFNGSILTHS